MIVTEHAVIRFQERYGLLGIPRDIMARLRKNDFIIARRTRNGCREGLLVHENRFIRFIYDKNKIITFLPPVGK